MEVNSYIKMMFSITTSKRLPLFLKTLNSLVSNCRDLSLITEILVIDDNSIESEIQIMRDAFFKVLPHTGIKFCTSSAIRGHAAGMQVIFSKLKGNFLFHCEDDWEFRMDGCPILASLDVLLSDPSIGQVAFSRDSPLAEVQITQTGTRYWLWEYDGSATCILGKHSTWPCFTLNPSIIRISALRSVGDFENVSNFEYKYGRRWVGSGFKTAYLEKGFSTHIGNSISAYLINQTSR
jgi:hypothetical protein